MSVRFWKQTLYCDKPAKTHVHFLTLVEVPLGLNIRNNDKQLSVMTRDASGPFGRGEGGPRTREWDSWGLINTVCEVSTWPQPVAAFTHKRHPLLPFCRRELPSSINSHDPAWLFINPPPRRPPPSFLPPSLSPQPQKYARTRARQATEHLSDKMAEDVKSLERREMCESGDSQTQWEKKTFMGDITKPVKPFRPHLKWMDKAFHFSKKEMMWAKNRRR